MAQHEHNGPGTESESPDHTESIWPPDDAQEETDDPATATPPGPEGFTPTPREQWFGGFEGEAPPPPPYARRPEDAPSPLPGATLAAPEPKSKPGKGEVTRDEPEEPRNGAVRPVPGNRRPDATPWREEEPRIPPRPSPTGREERDPLGPRRVRGDSDVPEPEQLPPLETERPGQTWEGSKEAGAPSSSDPEPSVTATSPRDQENEPAPRSPARRPENEPGVTADALNAATLVRNRRQGPSGGWRRVVHGVSLGLINPGESPKVLRERELVARACTPVATGHHRVAVLSLKGGVGKTTTTVALGATLASLRGDRILAVDANPDRGTLSDKVRLETAATIRDLLNERHLVSRYADIRGFTSQAPSRLEILASDRDPAVSEAFSDEDYREVARIVEHFYSICITDCGTGLLHSAMGGVLGLADQVVLVSSASVDGARSASATLDWLEAHGHGALVAGAVVVLSMVRSNSKSSVDLDRLEEHFAGRCRSVVRVPWDGHLEEGAEVDLDRLAPATKDAYLQLAANVGEAFAHRR